MGPIAALSPVEQWLLAVHRRHGRRGFVVAVAGSSIVLSMGLTGPMMFVLSTEVDVFVVGLILSALVPSIVAPAIALSLSRLLSAIESAADDLHRLARTDALTDALNRRAFVDDAGALVGSRPDARVGMIDVDNFKDVNDRWGHGVGDAVLIRLAENLRRGLGGDAVIGRIGGDEFAVAVADGAAADLEARLTAACDLTEVVDGLFASHGMSEADRRPLADVLADADRDMYRRKRRTTADV